MSVRPAALTFCASAVKSLSPPTTTTVAM